MKLLGKLFSYFADRLIMRAMRTPYEHIGDYMERYWLIPYGCKWAFDFAARVHCIKRSDKDRAFHDHPWPYLTFILRGGYVEVKPVFESGIYVGESRTYYGPGSVLFRKANSWHRLEIIPGKCAWTLFITGPYKQRWGFLIQPQHKVYWKEFTDAAN